MVLQHIQQRQFCIFILWSLFAVPGSYNRVLATSDANRYVDNSCLVKRDLIVRTFKHIKNSESYLSHIEHTFNSIFRKLIATVYCKMRAEGKM